MSRGSWTIRPYRPEDRAAVRRICVETGFMGDPVQWQWRDEDSFADLFSSWYTDHDAAEAYVVADATDQVQGYLLGCADTSRVPDPVRALAPTVLRRGLLFRPGTAGVLWRGVRDVLGELRHGRRGPDPTLDRRWPAHLHIDLLPAARGTGVGTELIRTWLSRLRQQGVPGCHLGTMAENRAAIAFFEHVGFRTEGAPQPLPALRARDGSRLHGQLMVQQW
jgi:RimJ/RimL family protein N-acetyltransferase